MIMQGTLRIRPLESPENTAAEMMRMVELYHTDLGDLVNLSLPAFYELVKALPYRPDPKGLEFVSRPKFTLQKDFPIRDCDDKSLLIGCYLFANGIPFRFEGSSKRPDNLLHHVFVIADFAGKELVLDATYPHNKFGEMEGGTVYKIPLTGEIMNSQFATLEGNELGWSIKKIGRRLKKAGKYGAIAATGPAGVATYAAFKKRRAIKNALKSPFTISGDDFEDDTLGRSILDKIGTRIKKSAKTAGSATVKAAKKTGTFAKKGASFVAKNPALKDALASFVPGGSAALAMARGAAGKKKGTAKDPGQEIEAAGIDPKILIGGGFLTLLAVGMAFKAMKK